MAEAVEEFVRGPKSTRCSVKNWLSRMAWLSILRTFLGTHNAVFPWCAMIAVDVFGLRIHDCEPASKQQATITQLIQLLTVVSNLNQ